MWASHLIVLSFIISVVLRLTWPLVLSFRIQVRQFKRRQHTGLRTGFSLTKSPLIELYHVREWVANSSCLHSPIDFRRLEPRRLMRMDARAADPPLPSHTLAHGNCQRRYREHDRLVIIEAYESRSPSRTTLDRIVTRNDGAALIIYNKRDRTGAPGPCCPNRRSDIRPQRKSATPNRHQMGAIASINS